MNIWNDNEIGFLPSLRISLGFAPAFRCETVRKYNKINSKRNYLATYTELDSVWFVHVEMEKPLSHGQFLGENMFCPVR